MLTCLPGLEGTVEGVEVGLGPEGVEGQGRYCQASGSRSPLRRRGARHAQRQSPSYKSGGYTMRRLRSPSYSVCFSRSQTRSYSCSCSRPPRSRPIMCSVSMSHREQTVVSRSLSSTHPAILTEGTHFYIRHLHVSSSWISFPPSRTMVSAAGLPKTRCFSQWFRSRGTMAISAAAQRIRSSMLSSLASLASVRPNSWRLGSLTRSKMSMPTKFMMVKYPSLR